MLIQSAGETKPEEWFLSGFGRWVLAQERRYCRRMSEDIFGYYALQLGHDFRPLTIGAQVRHHAIVGAGSQCPLVADWRELPFAAETVDFVLMAHALESSPDPHAVLRESVRVLRPQGRLLIVGFNPWSLLGGARFAKLPWRKQWLSLLRIKDWLALLDMSVIEGRFAVFLPPHETRRTRQRFGWMEKAGRRWWPLGGGIYFLSAVKRVPGSNMVGRVHYRLPAWHAARRARRKG